MSKKPEVSDKTSGSFESLSILGERSKFTTKTMSPLFAIKEKTFSKKSSIVAKLAESERKEQEKKQVEIEAQNKEAAKKEAATAPKEVPTETKPQNIAPATPSRPQASDFKQTERPRPQQGGTYSNYQGGGQQQRGYQPYNQQQRPQGAFNNYQGQRPAYGQPRPQGSYSHGGGTYQPRPYQGGQGGQFQGGQRPAYGQRPFNPQQGGARPYTPNTGAPRPYMGGQPRPAFTGGAPRGGASLTPISTLVKKDSSRKKDYSRNTGSDESRTLSKRQKAKIFDFADGDYETEQRMGSRKLRVKKEKEDIKIVALESAVLAKTHLTVKELSEKISKPASVLLKKLMELGLMLTINSVVDAQTAELVANELGIKLDIKIEKTFEEKVKEVHKTKKNEKGAKKRAPVVTIMGHVDHGKTSLLDAIRTTSVASCEAGGITQHIGAYSIEKNKEKITFIDTPGHEAFSAMRARGAKVTDVAILVVAADDGIKAQTKEAIKHIKKAAVPMIVACNKIDKPEANIERVKQQLTEHEIVPEEWGGDVIVVPVSARTGEGIDKLLDTILLVSEMQALTAVSEKEATGTVLEAKLDKTRGVVATLLVQDGTLKVGDHVVAGTSFGRIKAMIDDSGKQVKTALPSQPVQIVGLDEVPRAGDFFYVVDASLSKKVIEERKDKIKADRIQKSTLSAEDFLAKVDEGKLKTVKLIIKSDVQGSAEALKSTLQALSNSEVRVLCITAVAGQITENDIALAQTSGAILIAFNIKVDSKIETIAKQNKIKINNFKIIYQAADFIEKEVKKLKEPKYKEELLGKAEIRNVFKLSTSGMVAGCMVTEGKIKRNALARLMRGDDMLTEKDTIDTLKIVKEDQREVSSGFECGIKLGKFNSYAIGDIIVCYQLIEIQE